MNLAPCQRARQGLDTDVPAKSELKGRFAFWFYGVIGLLTLAFCWKLVPETKGKHLEEIQALFQARVERSKT